jgi:hypothetical protein
MTPPHQYTDNPNAKRILIVCDEGLNRSATIRGQLQYWGHDCLTVGLNRNSFDTIRMLDDWADLTIFTAIDQLGYLERFSGFDSDHYQVWDIGPDVYKRPYNPELLRIVKEHIKAHEKELKPHAHK